MIFKNRITFSLLPILFVFISSLAVAQNNALLWEITGNGLDKPSYLFGTIHIKDKRVFQFQDSLMIVLNDCKTMAGELVIGNTNTEEIVNAIKMPGDTTLKMLVSKRDYKYIRKTVRKKHGVVYTLIINKIKPVYTAILLEEEAQKGKSGKKEEMEQLLDEYLQDYSRKQNKKIAGLETPFEQLAALEIMPLKQQAEMLLEVLRQETEPGEKKELENMIQAYLKKDLDSLYDHFIQQDMTEELMKSLLTDRNIRMADRMEPLMREQQTFTAVGAAHLPGEMGLLALLERKGYKVRAVR